jgi:hypothetical protein
LEPCGCLAAWEAHDGEEEGQLPRQEA